MAMRSIPTNRLCPKRNYSAVVSSFVVAIVVVVVVVLVPDLVDFDDWPQLN